MRIEKLGNYPTNKSNTNTAFEAKIITPEQVSEFGDVIIKYGGFLRSYDQHVAHRVTDKRMLSEEVHILDKITQMVNAVLEPYGREYKILIAPSEREIIQNIMKSIEDKPLATRETAEVLENSGLFKTYQNFLENIGLATNEQISQLRALKTKIEPVEQEFKKEFNAIW